MKIGIILLGILLYTACPMCDPGIKGTIQLPELSETWVKVFGEPHWRLLLYESGSLPKVEILSPGTRFVSARFIPGAVYPVLVYPFWPDMGLPPGAIKPAGAVYPADVYGQQLQLSWLGGISAFFFIQLAAADGLPHTRPENLNWIRFTDLFLSDLLPDAVLSDPWKVDWIRSAAKIRAKGFDRRRITLDEEYTLDVILPAAGPWIPSSPFLSVLDGNIGTMYSIQTGSQGISLFSAQGCLQCNSAGTAYFPNP